MRGRLVLLVASLTLALSVSEAMIRASIPFPARIPDESLLYRLNPRFPDVDMNGFRNAEVLGSYEVVALGDSHTYGNNVEAFESWPARLQSALKRPVYNMGIGSYGVYQYYRTFLLARQYSPSHVIVALYPANDLQAASACAILELSWWRNRLVAAGLGLEGCPELVQDPVSAPRRLNRWLRRHSAFVVLVGNTLTRLAPAPSFTLRRDAATLELTREDVSAHVAATSLDSDVNRRAFRNSVRLFTQMTEVASPEEIRLGVLIIPSKERVFVNWAGQDGVVPPPVLEAVRSEERLTAAYQRLFDELGVPTVDPTAEIAQKVEQLVQQSLDPYPSGDGHPLAPIYEVYSRAAASLMH